MKEFIVAGVFGVAYVSLRQYLINRQPKFDGRVAEFTELIAWNATLMECIQQISVLLSEEELLRLMERLSTLHREATSNKRSSVWKVQTQISDILNDLNRLINRTTSDASIDTLRKQIVIVEDVLPTVEEILQNIQHNHMLLTL
jgi:hypothetical protein